MNKVFIKKETEAGETRSALVPPDVKKLVALGYQIAVQGGVGKECGFTDKDYTEAGATVVASVAEGYAFADMVIGVNKTDNPSGMKEGTVHISSFDVFNNKPLIKNYADEGLRLVSLEMIPRSTIAQKMDILSSQANLAGYYAVLLAANKLPKVFPMMSTPSGTIQPAKVFIIGVGVAGLQAIATAKRLGARVEAFDTRPVVEEQVKSLGAKFVKIDLGEMGQTEQGYAKELTPEQVELQRKGQAKVCAASDVVITTAKVFGRKAPILLTKDMLKDMKPGSVVIDMATKTGGNVEGADPNKEVLLDNGVLLVPGDGLERFLAKDASAMFSGNIAAFLTHFWDKEKKVFDMKSTESGASTDDILKGCLITANKQVLDPRFV